MSRSHFIVSQDKAPEASWPVEERHWAFVQQSRRAAAARSSWPLVWIALAIVIIAIKGLGL
jgi:hypothetical protein